MAKTEVWFALVKYVGEEEQTITERVEQSRAEGKSKPARAYFSIKPKRQRRGKIKTST